jgi:hypothetical protein
MWTVADPGPHLNMTLRLAQSVGRELASFRLTGLTIEEFVMHLQNRLASGGGTHVKS